MYDVDGNAAGLGAVVQSLETLASNTPALIDADGSVIHRGALADAIRRNADTARPLEGARIAALLPDTAQAAVALLSLVGVNSVLPLNPNLTDDQIHDLAAEGGVDAVLGLAPFDQRAAQLAHRLEVTCLTFRGHQLQPATAAPRPSPRKPVGLVLNTSGSTGAPKRVPLRVAQLILSARNIARHLALSPSDRAVHALPLFHVGALVDLLFAPLLAGGSVAFAADKTPQALRACTLEQGGTWLQLVPTMLTRCLAELDGATTSAMGARLRFIRMVSSDLPETLQAEAEEQFGGTPLIQMYGMTETAGQIAANPLPPALRKPGSVGVAAGPELAIIDTTGAYVHTGGEGEVCVRGDTVMTGYEGDQPTAHHGDWLRSGDLGRLDADGYLFLTGRAKEIINRGGEKISPLTVERAAATVPGISEAVAYALPHPTLGEQVGLSVVTKSPEVTEADILKALAPLLAEFERPRHVSIREQMPRLPGGKLDRRRLAAEGGAHAAPRDRLSDLGQKIAQLWQTVLNTDMPLDEDDFFDVGGDSLSGAEFLTLLEKELRLKVPANLLFDHPRFGQLVTAVESMATSPQRRTRQSRQPRVLRFVAQRMSGWKGQAVGPARLVLARNTAATGRPVFFCVNEPQVADAFSGSIGLDRPHYILRSDFEMPFSTRYDKRLLAQTHTEQIMAIQPEGPLILGGFCQGGVLMIDVARRLAAKGRRVALFLAIDSVFDQPTPYPVVHIWTTSRRFSIKGLYDIPARSLNHFHPAGSARFLVEGLHGRVIRPKRLAPIAGKIGALIDSGPPPLSPYGDGVPLTERRARWRAALRGALPWRMQVNAHITVPQHVTNRSAQTWPASAQSGLGVEANFVDLRGPKWRVITVWRKRLTGPKTNPARLKSDLPPGQSTEVQVQISAPNRPGLFLLRVSMVDEGYGHFLGRWRGARVRPVLVTRRP